jgi:hypothetical protein
LLIFTEDTVTAVVYEEEDGWTVVSKISADTPRTETIDDIIEYRNYNTQDEEKVHEFVTELYGTLGEQ